jgi:hypothetical protein
MPKINLKPTHKSIVEFYSALGNLQKYILRLIGQICAVSLETVETIKELEKLKLSD